MGMDRPFPFSDNLSKLLMRHDLNINLEPLWKMVAEFNSRTMVLYERVEASKHIQNLELRNGVMWLSFSILGGFCALIAIGRLLLYLFSGKKVKQSQDQKEEGIDAGAVPNGDDKAILVNGFGHEDEVLVSGHTEKKLDEVNDCNEILVLREELTLAKEEIAGLMPFRDEADALRSRVDLMSKSYENQAKEVRRVELLEMDFIGMKIECESLRKQLGAEHPETESFHESGPELGELRTHLQTYKEDLSKKETTIELLKTDIETLQVETETLKTESETLKAEKMQIEKDLETAYKEFETVTQRAAESCDIEARLRADNAELTKKMEELIGSHERESKDFQELHENDLAKQQLAHEQDKQRLRDMYEGKVKEAREGTRRRPDSIASSNPSEMETSPGRRTPGRLLASIKRHSRSSLTGSFTENSAKGPGYLSKESKLNK